MLNRRKQWWILILPDLVCAECAGPGHIPIIKFRRQKTEQNNQGYGDTGKLWRNLLDCVKSRAKPLSPVDVGARVQAPLNMAILSYRESKVAAFHAQEKKILI